MTPLRSLPSLAPASLRHRVITMLREAIIIGQFQPGDRLVEEDICQQLGISRGPLREALRQLEQEGLVVSFPYRATEVIGVSEEEVREILIPVRLTLERFAFRHALPQLSESDLIEFQQLVDAMRSAATTTNLAQVVDADVRFHELVLERSGQHHCTQVWRTISPRVRAYFFRCALRHSSLMNIVDEHVELLAAMQSRNLDAVLALLEQHILAETAVGRI